VESDGPVRFVQGGHVLLKGSMPDSFLLIGSTSSVTAELVMLTGSSGPELLPTNLSGLHSASLLAFSRQSP
jgi:hypothetical protein